jgi:peptidyl-prolyl cis-trans isomerase A (cyclophilin A)
VTAIALLTPLSCGRHDAAQKSPPPPPPAAEVAGTGGGGPDGAPPSAAAPALVPINPPPSREVPLPTAPADVVREAQVAAATGERDRLVALVTRTSRDMARTLNADQLRPYLGATAPTGDTTLEGARAVVSLERRPSSPVVVLLQENDRWRVDFRTTAGWRSADPGPKDRANRPVSLDAALAGLDGAGPLVAELATPLGTLRCRLFPERAPLTVANFVALARGLRAFVDPKSGAWTQRPFYDGLTFHRAVAGVLAQGGDPLGSGRGGPGYEIPDELDPSLRFDRAGIIAMANRGPNTNGSQFFVTARALPELDGRNTVFGVCDPVDLVARLAAVPTGEGERPLEPLRLDSVTVTRGE